MVAGVTWGQAVSDADGRIAQTVSVIMNDFRLFVTNNVQSCLAKMPSPLPIPGKVLN